MLRNENIGSSTPLRCIKHCHIIKRPDFEGYGFNLHSEKVKPGQFIGQVDPNSPAELAGLKEGARIIEVNGVNISQESHKQVVQRIKSISNEVRLLIEDVVGSGINRPQFSCGPKEHLVISQKMPENNHYGQKLNVMEKPNLKYITNCSTSNTANEILRKESESVTRNTKITKSTGTPILPNGSSKVSIGELELPITAAEMRAKLLSKKKYDAKTEVVDLKQKFEIIQKL